MNGEMICVKCGKSPPTPGAIILTPTYMMEKFDHDDPTRWRKQLYVCGDCWTEVEPCITRNNRPCMPSDGAAKV